VKVGDFVLKDEDGTFVESVGVGALVLLVGALELVSGALGLIDGALVDGALVDVDGALVDGALVDNDESLGASTSSLGRFVLVCAVKEGK